MVISHLWWVNGWIPSAVGRIAKECWQEIPDHFPFVNVEPFVIMPNHIHGIMTIIDESCRGTISSMRQHDRAPTKTLEKFSHPVIGSVPTIVRTFKSAVPVVWVMKEILSIYVSVIFMTTSSVMRMSIGKSGNISRLIHTYGMEISYIRQKSCKSSWNR